MLRDADRPPTSGRRTVVIAISTAILALAGCTAESTTPQSQDPESTAAVDPHEWVPDEKISHRTYTDEELEEYRAEYLAEKAEDLTSPAPGIELERWVTTIADDASTISSCLTESGFPAKPIPAGGVEFDPAVPGTQDDALNLAMYVCTAKYTPVPALTTDWTPEQIGMAWDYWNEAFIPCLRDHDLPIPDEEVPSRQTYIDTFFTPERYWMPSSWIESAYLGDDAKIKSVSEMCPPMPPHEYFYGS